MGAPGEGIAMDARAGGRAPRVRSALPLLTAVAAVAGLLSGCAAPPTEEVIPHGEVPEDGVWCELVSTEDLETLLGDADVQRVREVRGFGADAGPSSPCAVAWADGDERVEVVSSHTLFTPGGGSYLDAVTSLRDFLGPEGERLGAGDVEELQPGVYFDVGREFITVFETCENGGSAPALRTGSLYLSPAPGGDQLAPGQIASLGERLTQLLDERYACPGEVRPLGAGEWEGLAEAASR
ncbi:hypothetical protein [Microbacterium lushaniae]|uniref:Uncharacterized protein n=1 Tax=Microbacterium lushaniae TaxID=2614639 RepID=A0A5J6L0W1_9MICO|nr:hypothetical protein [Microbacterium lushaniae]QEW02026.1 hypothetical protein F6J85_02205 [Microbacterium lushaniae]